MAKTLVVNPGSTSRKYALYTDGVLSVVLFFEETGDGFAVSVSKGGVKLSEETIAATQFAHSVAYTLTYLAEHAEITSIQDIQKVAVRVVAPGTYFTEHREIDEAYVAALEAVQDVAPLHIPGLIQEIHACLQELSHATIVGVSDTAFHVTIPEHVSAISIDHNDAERFDIKRFGYHGLSFASIAYRLTEIFGEVPKRTIVCHVGGGVSVAALVDGKSVATSMGYTPASGMIMGSRGGDVTAGVIATLMQKKKMKVSELYDYLYKESGFQGVAGVRDMRLVLERASQKDEQAQLALDMFVHQVHAWIASHAVQMGGVDAVVLTATASERNPQVRSLLMSNLELLGVHLDQQKNEDCINCEGIISTDDSSAKIAVIKTDESGEIVRTAESF